MTDAVETMAWRGEVPWHGLGYNVKDGVVDIKAAGCDWTVSKRKMFYAGQEGDTNVYPATGDYALVRDPDNFHLSTVGATWKEIQNSQAFDFFTKFTKEGKMVIETAGSLWGGRYVWVLARIGKDFSIGKKDEIRPYILLASPHVHGKALLMQYTAIRVVCWNTFCAAIGASMKGDGTGFRVPHSMAFDDATKAKAEEALGLAIQQTVEFKEIFTLLSKKKMTVKDNEEYFCEVLQFDPKKADKKKKGDEIIVPRMLPKFQTALTHAPGQELPSALGTLWGSFNAVTATIDHQTGRNDRSTALKNIWLGHQAGVKRRALDLALARVK